MAAADGTRCRWAAASEWQTFELSDALQCSRSNNSRRGLKNNEWKLSKQQLNSPIPHFALSLCLSLSWKSHVGWLSPFHCSVCLTLYSDWVKTWRVCCLAIALSEWVSFVSHSDVCAKVRILSQIFPNSWKIFAPLLLLLVFAIFCNFSILFILFFCFFFVENSNFSFDLILFLSFDSDLFNSLLLFMFIYYNLWIKFFL